MSWAGQTASARYKIGKAKEARGWIDDQVLEDAVEASRSLDLDAKSLRSLQRGLQCAMEDVQLTMIFLLCRKLESFDLTAREQETSFLLRPLCPSLRFMPNIVSENSVSFAKVREICLQSAPGVLTKIHLSSLMARAPNLGILRCKGFALRCLPEDFIERMIPNGSFARLREILSTKLRNAL